MIQETSVNKIKGFGRYSYDQIKKGEDFQILDSNGLFLETGDKYLQIIFTFEYS